MARLIVTRPAPQAEKTIQALSARGHNVTHMPLTEIKPLAHSSVLPPNIEALIATSSNALTYAARELLDQLSNKPLYCVGSKTAQMAVDLGLAPSVNAVFCRDNAEDLAQELLRARAQSYIYLCSKHRMSTIDDILPKNKLHIIETYEAPFKKPEIELSTSVDGVLLYSVRTAQSWAKSGLIAQFHFCLSENIAQCLPESQRKTAKIATKPLEGHLFAEVDKIFSSY